MIFRRVVLALLAALFLLVFPAAASAADYTVNSTADQEDETPGDEVCKTAANTCTLRAAIEESNASINAIDKIVFRQRLRRGASRQHDRGRLQPAGH